MRGCPTLNDQRRRWQALGFEGIEGLVGLEGRDSIGRRLAHGHASGWCQHQHQRHRSARRLLGDAVVQTCIAGCVGQAAALDMMAYIHVADKLTAWEVVIEKPEAAPVSDDQIANMIMAYGAVTRVSKETIDAFMKYLGRLPSEIQIMFLSSLIKSSKAGWAVLNKSVTTACRKLEVFL